MQLLDMGIIKSFKDQYKRLFLNHLLYTWTGNINNILGEINLLAVINLGGKAWIEGRKESGVIYFKKTNFYIIIIIIRCIFRR